MKQGSVLGMPIIIIKLIHIHSPCNQKRLYFELSPPTHQIYTLVYSKLLGGGRGDVARPPAVVHSTLPRLSSTRSSHPLQRLPEGSASGAQRLDA